jgi:hypothetical protein
VVGRQSSSTGVLSKDSLEWIPAEVNIGTALATVHSPKSQSFHLTITVLAARLPARRALRVVQMRQRISHNLIAAHTQIRTTKVDRA